MTVEMACKDMVEGHLIRGLRRLLNVSPKSKRALAQVVHEQSRREVLKYQGSHRVWKTGKTGKKIMVREKSGKSQGILFWAKSQGKVREFCFKLSIAMKICCYSCRLSRMFVTVFTI